MRVLVYLIETNFLLKNKFWSKKKSSSKKKFLLKKKALYFFYGMKKSVQVVIWLALVLLTWVLLFDCGVERSPEATRILNRVTWTIVAFLIGAFLWLLKTLLLKILASSFQVNTFFDRIKQSVFHLYVLQTLSGRPLAERLEKMQSARYLSLKKGKKGKEKEQLLDISKLDKMKQEKVSASTMKVLVDLTANSEMSTILDTLNESVGNGGDDEETGEINVEVQGMAAAKRIFKNVAPNGRKPKYIVQDDLTKFLSEEEVQYVYELVDGAKKTQKIELTSLTDWVFSQGKSCFGSHRKVGVIY
ncbi:hypothetical protein L1049_018046 [Liquidambar formosana]|uniref:Uncharacterized protein n=1 Tax=Liquidambar formosana TaxID=63359 RepID=A0AAP0R8W5_LIQFO